MPEPWGNIRAGGLQRTVQDVGRIQLRRDAILLSGVSTEIQYIGNERPGAEKVKASMLSPKGTPYGHWRWLVDPSRSREVPRLCISL